MKHQRVIEQPQRSTSNCCSKFNNYVIVHNLLLNTCTTMTPMSRDLLLSRLRYYDNSRSSTGAYTSYNAAGPRQVRGVSVITQNSQRSRHCHAKVMRWLPQCIDFWLLSHEVSGAARPTAESSQSKQLKMKSNTAF